MSRLNVINALDNIELSGLHIHRTSHARRVEFYEQTIDYTAKIIEQYHLKLNYIDVGGGYFGIFGNKPTHSLKIRHAVSYIHSFIPFRHKMTSICKIAVHTTVFPFLLEGIKSAVIF